VLHRDNSKRRRQISIATEAFAYCFPVRIDSGDILKKILLTKMRSEDGGGVRGLSTLIILRYLMAKVNSGLPPEYRKKLYQIFDMIGGTSTSGYAFSIRFSRRVH
jgi:hypothetical protein